MEAQDQDFSFFISRKRGVPMGPVDHINHLAGAENASGFWRKKHGGRLERGISRRIVSALEDIFETPLYGIELGSWHRPSLWRPVLTALHEKRIIDAPQFYSEMLYNDMPKTHIFSMRPHPESLFARTRAAVMGSSFDAEDARIKAMGEFLERYALIRHPEYFSKRASVSHFEKKGARFLNPSAVAGSFFFEGKSTPFSRDDELIWVRGRSFPEGHAIWLPAELVFWHLGDDGIPGSLIREPNSNGSAGMFSRERALLSAIYELLQRDAFLLFWLNHIAPPRIIPESIEDRRVTGILDAIRRYDLGVEILDITSDFGVPAFTAVLLDGSSDKKRITVGAGCGPDPAGAIAAALTEAIAIAHFARARRKEIQLRPGYRQFSESIGQNERIQLWSNPEMFSRCAWFLNGKKKPFLQQDARYRVTPGTETELLYIQNTCREKGEGYRIYYYEPENAIMRMFGYHAVKVIIPAVIPLYLNECYAPLNAERLRSVPAELGYSYAKFPEPMPHPFA